MTGLHYAVNRSYSSEQGRFTQVDPIGMSAASLSDPQTLNMYAYCGNDPINNLDPDGLFWGAIGRFFKAIGIAIATFFGSGGGVSSGPDFRTPPTFPGSLPGINAAIRSGMGGFRTPPFNPGASGFLGQDKKALGNLIRGVNPSEVEETIQAIIALRDLWSAGLNPEQLVRFSNKQIIALRDALRRGDVTIINDHEFIVHTDDFDIKIVGVEQPGTPAPTPVPTPVLPKYAGKTVGEILKSKKGSITNAPLTKGSPSWDSIRNMTWEQIDEAAKAGKTGYGTIRKLLTNKRFDK